MTGWSSAAPSVLASFMASMVEFVEALTIVLAVGLVRGWRSALMGAAAALVVLVALVASLGPSLARIPLPVVQLIVGTLLLLFGLRWLRKAVLRAAGVLALHDEVKAFETQTEALRRQGAMGQQAFDTLAFMTSFKIVMLEGIEVVFIVIAIGASGQMMLPASIGALMALLVVVVLGLWLHRPLARVPENTLKFGVGVMLSAFGTFWVGEGLGVEWPGVDWALLGLIATYLIAALMLLPACARWRGKPDEGSKAAAAPNSKGRRGALAVVGGELFGLFVNDGWLAAGIVAWVLLVGFAVVRQLLSPEGTALAFTAGLVAGFAASAIRRARH